MEVLRSEDDGDGWKWKTPAAVGQPRYPAVRRDRPDLALPSLPVPTELAESWRVNLTDELTQRDRTGEGRFDPATFTHNNLHQVVERQSPASPASYTWDVNGNLQSRTGGLFRASFTFTRQGQPVQGTTTRITAQLFHWTPADATTYPIGGTFTLTVTHLTDLTGSPATAATTFTHLTTTPDLLLLAYAAPTDTQPETVSTYGLTTLFQGRSWHGDLGMYYYRARWYLPAAGVFGERDPMDPSQGVNLYSYLNSNPVGILDPMGRQSFGPFGGFNYEPGNKVSPRRTPGCAGWVFVAGLGDGS